MPSIHHTRDPRTKPHVILTPRRDGAEGIPMRSRRHRPAPSGVIAHGTWSPPPLRGETVVRLAELVDGCGPC